jgi:hypothetical protein
MTHHNRRPVQFDLVQLDNIVTTNYRASATTKANIKMGICITKLSPSSEVTEDPATRKITVPYAQYKKRSTSRIPSELKVSERRTLGDPAARAARAARPKSGKIVLSKRKSSSTIGKGPGVLEVAVTGADGNN